MPTGVLQMIPVDPVCGRVVGTEGDFFSEYGGRRFYFCTYAHKEQFELDPDKYLPKIEQTPAGREKRYR